MTTQELFEQYRKNYSEWNELEKLLMKPNTREAWYEDFCNTMTSFQTIYDSNKLVIDKITKILQNLDETTAEEIFAALRQLYFERCRDSEFLIFVSTKLIEYYEKEKNDVRVIHLRLIRENSNYIVGNPEGLGKDFDISDTKEVMSYLDRYAEFDYETRYRIWVAYYNYIARLSDLGVVDLLDALDSYDKITEFMSKPEIQKLDENCEKIDNIKSFLSQAMFVCIALIDKIDAKGRKRFYQYTKRFFAENKMDFQSPYELPAELFACHLFNEYMEGSKDIDTVFRSFADYISYRNRLIQSKTEYNQDEVIQSINVIRYLTNLGKYATDQKMVSDAIHEIVDIVQSNWVKSNLVFYERMSDMLGKACFSLISFDLVGIDKEKCITQLIIQRDINVFIDAKVTTEIALALYREMTTTAVDYFDEVKSIPSNRWKDFLYHCSMFHDIGSERVCGTVVLRSRPLFEEEIKRQKRHTLYGAMAMSAVESTEKYAEVIKGHHTYYNLENVAEYEYDRSGTDLNAFTDIVALASYISTKTDYFWNFEKKSKTFKVLLHDLKSMKDTRFNGRLIDAILCNEVLQKEIERIVTSLREDIVYDVYHNWERIQLSQDEDSMLAECLKASETYRHSKNEEEYAPFLKQLEYLSESTNESIRNQANYAIMIHKFLTGQFEDGLSMGSEVERYIKKTKNYELLIEYYMCIGKAECLRDNIDTALSNYLSAIFYSEKTPGTEDTRNMCYLDMACIFSMKFNYARAKYYFDKCNMESMNVDEKLQYLCMKGYCYVKLGITDRVGEVRKTVIDLINNNKDHVIYPHYVYLAIFAAEMKDKDSFDESLKEMEEQVITAEDIAYYSDEMFMYIELLATHGKGAEAAAMIDRYVELCGDHKEYAAVLTKLLNIKIGVVASQNGYDEISEYEDKIREAFYASCQDEALKIEAVEKDLVEEIKLRAEHEEILSNKEVLEESVKRAKSDSESKSQFLSSMSHEIRTPINAIIGFNEMIMRECNEPEILQYSANIDNAGKQLLGIINDILDYSKIDAGKMVIVPQNYRIKEMVEDIKNMVAPKVAEKNLEFAVNFNSDIPYELLGDDLRIKQILLNLLSNAYKYTPEGKVSFGVDYKKLDEKTIVLIFSVEDTGIGLRKDQIKKIANPFERFELSKNHSIEGTGLGMNIVTRLLEQMDSKLEIESEFGVGSKFSFELKQSVVEWRSSNSIGENRMAMLRTSGNSKTVKKGLLHAPNARVLIVDDNAVNLKVAVALLKRTEIQVMSAASGKECLELCAQNEFHVILLDHMMPEMDGVETLAKLKEAGGFNATTPVVALTANVVDSADDFYEKAGFDALLTKPINAERMEELLSSLLPEYLVED